MRFIITALVVPAFLQAQSGEQLFRERRYDDARAAFQARVAKNKGDDSAFAYLGRIAMVQNRAGDAADLFEKAVALRDSSARYHDWLGSALGLEATTASKFRQPFLARRVKKEFERA